MTQRTITTQVNDNLMRSITIDTASDRFNQEYFNKDNKRHYEDGPAITYKDNNVTYLEWWQEGKLIATFDEGKQLLRRSTNGDFTGLKDATILDKWVGYERTLSVHDVGFCPIVELQNGPVQIQQTIKINKDMVKNNAAAIEQKMSAPRNNNGYSPN